jgi:hypothetical protein
MATAKTKAKTKVEARRFGTVGNLVNVESRREENFDTDINHTSRGNRSLLIFISDL